MKLIWKGYIKFINYLTGLPKSQQPTRMSYTLPKNQWALNFSEIHWAYYFKTEHLSHEIPDRAANGTISEQHFEEYIIFYA